MIISQFENASLPIFLSDPVNHNNPILVAQQAWWIPISGTEGGKFLYDLLGFHHATLTNGPKWTSSEDNSTPFGSIYCTGGQDFRTPSFISVPSGGNFTLRVVFRPRSYTGTFTILFDSISGARNFTIFLDTSGNVIVSGSMLSAVPNSLGMSVGNWWDLLISRDSSGSSSETTYLNGVFRGIGFNSSTLTGPEGIVFGFNTSGGGTQADTDFAEVSYWNRALSATEADFLYKSRKTGYPDLINRVKSSPYILQAQTSNYSGVSSCSKSGTLTSTGSSAVPVYHFSCDLTKQTQVAVSATATAPVYSGNSSVTKSALIQVSGTAFVPNYTAAASCNKSSAISCSASSSVPVYHSNSDTSKKAQISGAATHIQPGFNTTCFVNKSAQFTALATLVVPNYSGLSSVSKKALENSSSTITVPNYHGTAFVSKNAACLSLSSIAFSSPGSLTSSEIIKRENSLDRGRLAWWVALSGAEGGRFFYDIIGSAHGVLTNMTGSSSGWASTVRLGGLGQINFDGSNDLIRAPAVVTRPPFTIACWFYSSDYADFRTLVDIGAAGQTNSHIRLMTTLLGTVRLNTIDSAGSQGLLDTITSGVPKQWYCAVATIPEFDPALLYLNGNVAPSNLTASSYNLFDSTTFGALPWSSNIQFHMGAVDNISLWNRILSPDEILDHYRERDYLDVRNDFNLSSQAVTQNYSAIASVSKQSQFSGSATFTAPVYHAGASLTKSPQISSAFSPQYHAACALTVSHIENSSANFSIVAKDAAALLSKHPIMYGVGSLTTPPHATISVSKKSIFMGHAVNSNPNPGQPFYYVKRKHYIKKTFFR